MTLPRLSGPTRALAPVVVIVCAAILAGACGGAPSPATDLPGANTSSTATVSDPPSTSAGPVPTASPSEVSTPTSVMGKRCGQPDVRSSTRVLAGPEGAKLALSEVGSGETVALLLHQTDRVASCGWWPFATRLAAAGVRVEMLDFCQYGASTCTGAFVDDYPAQVAVAVQHLRSTGLKRLVIVGASLGGTVAVNSATAARADAVVDLSGFGYGPLVTAGPVAALRMPLLAAASPDDNPDSDRLAAEVTASGAPVKRFVPTSAGHGWSMVLDGPFADAETSDLGRTVMAWVKGDTSA